MKWFPLHKTKVLGGAPDVSLGQKYLTTADPFDLNYNTPDQHRDLKKLTCPTTHLLIVCLHFSSFYFWAHCIFLAAFPHIVTDVRRSNLNNYSFLQNKHVQPWSPFGEPINFMEDIIAILFSKIRCVSEKKARIKPFFSWNSESVLFQQEGSCCVYFCGTFSPRDPWKHYWWSRN